MSDKCVIFRDKRISEMTYWELREAEKYVHLWKYGLVPMLPNDPPYEAMCEFHDACRSELARRSVPPPLETVITEVI